MFVSGLSQSKSLQKYGGGKTDLEGRFVQLRSEVIITRYMNRDRRTISLSSSHSEPFSSFLEKYSISEEIPHVTFSLFLTEAGQWVTYHMICRTRKTIWRLT